MPNTWGLLAETIPSLLPGWCVAVTPAPRGVDAGASHRAVREASPSGPQQAGIRSTGGQFPCGWLLSLGAGQSRPTHSPRDPWLRSSK